MELSQYVEESTVEAVRRLLPDAPLTPILSQLSSSSEPSVSVELPFPEGAEYRFVLFFVPERQIHARVLDADPSNYFWYMPFEDSAFSNSIQELDASFIDTVDRLVRHETRIIQKRGFLNYWFKCEYKAADEWKRVYSHAALRVGGFRPPPAKARVRVYTAPAIMTCCV